MKTRSFSPLAVGLLVCLVPTTLLAQKKSTAPAKPQAASAAGAVTGWIHWRGPNQDGTSPETGLPEKIDGKSALWTADFPGQSAPVIANGKLYIVGYVGDGADLQEAVACFDAESGKMLWDHRWSDYLSDTIYLRYATSSPTIDPETGNVYVQGTNGPLFCFSPDGKVLWEHSMMEEYGRMTFPNSRTATPVIDKELVITRGITSGWGANGAAGDRFFAFDKKTGDLVWLSWPTGRPQDNTFSPPLMSWLDGQRVLFSAAGDSSVVCVNARTGDPVFSFPAAKAGAKGGINAGVLRYKDSLLVVHESENIDTSEVGRTAAYKIPTGSKQPEPGKPQVYETKSLELWRNPLGTLASSPCIVGNRMYEVTGVGELACIDVDSGKILWRKKLGVEQRQSSPFFADGKLYVAFYIAGTAEGAAPAEGGGGNGEFFIIKPSDAGPEILSRTILEGRCYGSPIAYNGKIYVQTDRKLYCFGKAGASPAAKTVVFADDWPKIEKAAPARLQLIPNEVLMRPGQAVQLRARAVDANGFTVIDPVDIKQVKMDNFVPPTALVKAKMNGKIDAAGVLTADKVTEPTAGAFQGVYKANGKEITGTMRGRVLPSLPMAVDFENVELELKTDQPPPPAVPNTMEPSTAFNYPPLAWNAARFRFEVRQSPAGGTKALVKTISDKRFQRGQVFIGHPDMRGYTMEADLLTEGNRRKMSEMGLINQRYLILLKGNAQRIEISSNQERLIVSAPFKLAPNEWYRLKTRVDVAKDGAGVVKAKAWKKGEPEPEAWTIEVPHKTAHRNGAPGFFSLAAQDQRAWFDNISVTPNPETK